MVESAPGPQRCLPDAAERLGDPAANATRDQLHRAHAASSRQRRPSSRAHGRCQRLNVWKDELVAWFKTLASAAVYATLIVTFGFQVARVEGQSMAPTLEDQDRLIVNKLAYRHRRRRARAIS